MVGKLSTREAFGRTLADIGEQCDIWVLDADLSKATRTEIFAKKYPERFLNMGIAEGDMISTAAGIATCGKIVFASTFAMFAAGRAYEQIRNSVAYPGLNVKIAATHGGVLIGEDGGSHQCIEDIALMRAIPGMVVLAPADAVETEAAIKAAVQYQGPMYIRMGRFDVPIIYNREDFSFEIGKGKKLTDGDDVTIIAIGDMVYEALVAAGQLEKEGIGARVLDMASVKPIDVDLVLAAARETGAIVTAEDHNVVGGLGSAVAEVVAEYCPVPVRKVGIKDIFGQSGSRSALADYYGLNADNIIANVHEILRVKERISCVHSK